MLHRDDGMWAVSGWGGGGGGGGAGGPRPDLSVSCMWALSDFTAANGSTRVVRRQRPNAAVLLLQRMPARPEPYPPPPRLDPGPIMDHDTVSRHTNGPEFTCAGPEFAQNGRPGGGDPRWSGGAGRDADRVGAALGRSDGPRCVCLHRVGRERCPSIWPALHL